MATHFNTVAWAEGGSIYEVNIRQYTPEGTFKAFQQHLPRLKDMGITIIWLMPITQISEAKRQGSLGSYYACSSYTTINHEFGTLEDFKELVSESILAAAEEKKAELDDKNKKEKPVELIKAALRKLEKCDEYLKNNREYLDKNTREGFKSQFKRVKKKVENIEEILKNDVEN